MKSEYRQAVESVISQEAKLAEVIKLHAEAAAREKQFSEALRFNRETLEQYERRVIELELVGANPEIQEIRAAVTSLQASVKMLCRESVRTEA